MLKVLTMEVTTRPAVDHIRMHLDDHGAVRMIPECFQQHLLEALRSRQPQSNGAISSGLVHDENKRLPRRWRLFGWVDFAQPQIAPQTLKQTSAPGLLRSDGFCDALLQPTRLSGIEMNAKVIHHQGQRRVPSPFGQRTQQTVLEMPHRQLPALTKLLHPQCAGATPPGQQSIHIATTPGQQLRRRQQSRHGAVGQQAPLRNTEALIHRVGEIAVNPLRWIRYLELWR